MKTGFHITLTPGRKIVLAFAGMILIGALLLMLPISRREGVSLSILEALFTATSASCVTGFVVMDTAESFSIFGRTVIILLVQMGGLGVAVLGVLVTALAGGHIGLRDRALVREAWNVSGYSGIVGLMKRVILVTLCFEGAGAALSTIAFMRELPFLKALGMGVFHAISSFNNAGFDLSGGFRGLTEYYNDPAINLITASLIICSGLGYLVWIDMGLNWRRPGRFSLQTKVVLFTTALLLVGGTLALKLSENISWLAAFFQSVSARSAGFASVDFRSFTAAGMIIMCFLMLIGASPGSTGGGMKTTTLFALCLSVAASARGSKRQAFRRKIPDEVFTKAFTLFFMSLAGVFICSLLIALFEPGLGLSEVLFEAVAAFSTAGISLGVTPTLGTAARIVLILTMFTGRLGPITMATVWTYRLTPAFEYSEENITIG